MEYLLKNLLKKRNLEDYGIIFFLSGIFFLPSTLFIGILFLLPSSFIGGLLQKKPFFKDPWNYPFIIFGVWILFSAIIQNHILINNYETIWDPKLSILGIGNWLPFIWLFWAFQPYLDSKDKRRNFSLILIAGSVPVLITGFGQYFMNWTGPFETLNGLIIWYQKPIVSPAGLSGLFSNQNYAGSWLNLVWPFCLALFLEKREGYFRKAIAFSFLFSVGFAAFLTYSRNAWVGLLTSFPIIIGKRALIIILPILTFIFVIFVLRSANLSGEIEKLLRNLFPERILMELTNEGYKGLDATRIEIFSSAINLIKENPFFGIGAGSFPAIFLSETNFWKGHSHNLLLELSISYGLPATIILFSAISTILVFSGRKIFISLKEKQYVLFEKALWTSLFFFLISQLVDIQYFDGKISIIAWVLIASLKNIIDEKDKNYFSY